MLRATTPVIAAAAEAERRVAAFNALLPPAFMHFNYAALAVEARTFRAIPTNAAWFRVAARIGGHERLQLADLLYICNNLPDLLRRLELHVPHIFAVIRAVASDSRPGRREEHDLMVIGMRVVSFLNSLFLLEITINLIIGQFFHSTYLFHNKIKLFVVVAVTIAIT